MNLPGEPDEQKKYLLENYQNVILTHKKKNQYVVGVQMCSYHAVHLIQTLDLAAVFSNMFTQQEKGQIT